MLSMSEGRAYCTKLSREKLSRCYAEESSSEATGEPSKPSTYHAKLLVADGTVDSNGGSMTTFLLDSGASEHMTYNDEWLQEAN